MKKGNLVTVLIILLILAFSYFLLQDSKKMASIQEVECIAENSVLYSQKGCVHCKTQEELFKENYDKLNVIECNLNWTKCGEIQGTPSWEINGEIYVGVQSIEKLKELTNC